MYLWTFENEIRLFTKCKKSEINLNFVFVKSVVCLFDLRDIRKENYLRIKDHNLTFSAAFLLFRN